MASKSFSKSWCKSFITKFLDALSARELRDIVYDCLVGQPGDVRIMPHDRSQVPDPNEVYGPYRVNFGFRGDSNTRPHYFDRDYIGTQFMIEIYDTFYTRAKFSVSHSYDVEMLLGNGVFCSHPASARFRFIRSLSITIYFEVHPNEQAYKANNCYEYRSGRGELRARKHEFEERVEQLSLLRRIEHAENFHLELTFYTYHAQTLPKYQEAFLPLIYDLKAMGMKIAVCYIQEGSSGCIDFMCKYDGPRAEWEKQIESNSAFVSVSRSAIRINV
jgi:hypothetical protein